MKQQLEYRYQDVRVIAEKYPLKNPRKLIYNIMIALEVIIIVIILLSDFIKPKIGQIINNAGAFEVFCDDKLIWSTIEHNGIKPNLSTIIRLVKEMQ